ncbi:MAG: aldehyde oxidase [Candidatus Latescibacterota bacterium]|nr:MAG: aldehyde oxidase [Candidatus Latescibacterota bacterium]
MSRKHHHVIGKDIRKVDGRQLVTGAPAFTTDFPEKGMLIGKILGSPEAHARIRSIDTSGARAIPGVHVVLTHENVRGGAPWSEARPDLFPRVAYTRAGQDYVEPSPWDFFLLDSKVRHVGDRVAAVAAESEEIALEALSKIRVEYETLPAVFTPEEAMRPGAPVVHDEPEIVRAEDSARNLCASVDVTLGDPAAGFAEADAIVEEVYRLQRVQHAQMELHAAIARLDNEGRLIVICTTQVPFHTRRQIAQALGLSIGRVRVIKPRIGGGFGGKQEMMIEDLCSALALASGRPVRLELSRYEDMNAARSRHSMAIRLKTGAKKDGMLTAIEMTALVDAGAYGSHSPTVPTNTGNKNLPRYRCRNVRYAFDAYYTNLPPTGAMRGYGTPQGTFALECHMDEVAEKLGMDPVEFRLKATVREGDADELSPHIYEVKKENVPEDERIVWRFNSCGLQDCIRKGADAIGWAEKRRAHDAWNAKNTRIKRGIGMATASQGSGVAGIDTAGATIKLNEDGSVALYVGAVDVGSGGDTVIAQIVAETLGIEVADVTVFASDTDITPFDSGAYASSTTYVSGGAALRAAEEVRAEILGAAAEMLGVPSGELRLEERRIAPEGGKGVSLRDVATFLAYQKKVQVEKTVTHVSPVSPPPFAAQFADLEVDVETGRVRVVDFVTAVDAGTILNPNLAEGQVHGAVSMGIGYALSEELLFDAKGRPRSRGFLDYKILKATGMPRLRTIFVETYEPSGPFGVKAVAEIPTNGPAPAIGNALRQALGVRLRDLPFTPEKVLRAIGKL